ncbi:MAG: LuxR C-terminal-related transcriptional regulator [bacterium]
MLDKVWENDYDVVLLDISISSNNVLFLLKQLKKEKSKLPILLLSIYPANLYAVRSLKAGASGYLTINSTPEELVDAIRKVAQGRKHITTALAEKLAFDLEMDNEKPLHEKLSDCEYQVMCMIASGKMVKEIAAELSLSVKTISAHRARILEKMNMKNSAKLTYYAIKQGLVD